MFGTLYFFGCCALLVAGYAVYGAFVERVFGADASRETPVMTRRDGVDFEPMPLWKLYMSQMINIAGLGPVIGTILGALYGPVALLWVVFGSIFAGAVHDYIAGMISIREDGISYPEIIGRNLGSGVRVFMECFTIIFMVMVGATFVLAPAALLASLFPHFLTDLFPSAPTLAWSVLIFAYYFVATIIPFDRIVSRFYPIVGVMLIFMALGLIVALFAKGYTILPNTDFFTNVHPAHTPVWPILFITIACGAISGFHATQSPLRARCMTNEKQGRRVFYGAMITEGVLGLIWATLALSFYPDAASLSAAMGPKGSPTLVVQQIALTLLGPVGGVLAILGVVLLPISTGDTAFRAARSMLADHFHIDQKSAVKRILTALPLFCGGVALTLLDFPVIWRYFGWANQTMSCVSLWAFSVWLATHGRMHWITTLPAVFMTTVCTAYICYAPIGFSLSMEASTITGIVVSLACLALFLHFARTGSLASSGHHGGHEVNA